MREFKDIGTDFEESDKLKVIVFIPYLHRGFVIESGMGSMHVIIFNPLMYFVLCILKVIKFFSFKQFISDGCMIAFDVAVVKGLSRGNKFLCDSPFFNNYLKIFRPELRAIISSEDHGRSIDSAKIIQVLSNGFAREGIVYRRLKGSTGEDIQYIEDSKASSAVYPVMEEITCPDMTWGLRLSGIKGLNYTVVFFPGYRGWSLKVEMAVDSIELFVINPDTLPFKLSQNHSVSPGRMFKSNSFYHLSQFFVISGAFSIERDSWDVESSAKGRYRDIEMSMSLMDKHFQLLSAQMFFLMMSVSACSSNSFSARSLFSLAFSSSRALRRFASDELIPLYFCLHLYMVFGLIPYFLATDETEFLGRSASAIILMIWSMENLFGLISLPLLLNNYTFIYKKFLHNRCLVFGGHSNGSGG